MNSAVLPQLKVDQRHAPAAWATRGNAHGFGRSVCFVPGRSDLADALALTRSVIQWCFRPARLRLAAHPAAAQQQQQRLAGMKAQLAEAAQIAGLSSARGAAQGFTVARALVVAGRSVSTLSAANENNYHHCASSALPGRADAPAYNLVVPDLRQAPAGCPLFHARHQPAAQGTHARGRAPRGARHRVTFLDVPRFQSLCRALLIQTRTEPAGAAQQPGYRDRPVGSKGDTGELMAQVASSDESKSSAERLEAIRTIPDAAADAPNLPHEMRARRRRKPATPGASLGHAARLDVRLRCATTSTWAPLGLDFDTAPSPRPALCLPARPGGAAFRIAPGAVHARHADREHGYTGVLHAHIVNARDPEAPGQLPKFPRRRPVRVSRPVTTPSARAVPHLHQREMSLTNWCASRRVARAAADPATAHSRCFRSGSAGRDTRGMIRQHQFDKVEMAQIVHPREELRGVSSRWSATPRRSWEAGAAPRRRAAALRHGLADQDLRPRGLAAGEHHREIISSCSNCEVLQARRMQARFKNAQGKNELCTPLNGLVRRGPRAGGGAGEPPAGGRLPSGGRPRSSPTGGLACLTCSKV